MRSHQPNPDPNPHLAPSKSSLTISPLHKARLSIDYLSRRHEVQIPQEYIDQATSKMQTNKKLRIPQTIKSLTLDLDKIPLPRNQASKTILNFLKEFLNLESLKIHCISFKNSPLIKKALKNFRSLRHLEVTFTRIASPFYLGDYIQDLIKAIYKSCPRLTELKLYFQDSPFAQTQDDYRSYLKNWRIERLNTLRELTLHLPISTFLQFKNEKKGILSLEQHVDLSPVKRFHKLKSLDIALIYRSSDKYTRISTNELNFDPNKLFPNVKHFTWNTISSWPVKIKEINPLGTQIASRLKHFSDFGLGFKQKEARVGVEIRELSQCLATLPTDLHRLYFVHGCGEVSGQDLEALISEFSLQRVRTLRTLSLEYPRCKGINNGFLADLAQGIAQNLTELRSIRLCFESNSEGQKGIFEAVKAMIGFEGISDKGIKNFARELSKGCLYLESVSLEFRKYSEISDKGVKSLCKKLDRLKSLKKVRIRFQDCENVTDIGCEQAVKKFNSERKIFFSCV